LGCPPCQGFSDTGKRDPDDPRNGHLTRFGTIALRLKPWAIAMENVPLAGSSPSFEHFLKRIARAGYRWTAGILNSALHGSAQCRHRLVFVGIRSDVGSSPRIPSPSHGGDWSYFSYRLQQMVRIDADHVGMLGVAPAAQRMRIGLPYVEEGVGSLRIPTVEEVMAGLPRFQTKEAKLSSHERWQHSASMIRRMSAVPEGGRWKGGRDHFAQSYGRLHRKGLARTITTYFSNPGSGRFWHPSDERCISIREAARIQGFPDTFLFPVLPSQAAVLVGNALDGSISDLIYRTIRRCLE
jgi:DNA (cytosine-5)-methyltransferase 1